MANWVKTRITFPLATNEEFSEIVEKYCVKDEITGDKVLDFEKIVPIPKDIYRGNIGPKEEQLYGKNTWYWWCVEHWGTKWNAFEGHVEPDDKSIIFNTAWAFAKNVVAKLAELTHQETEAMYADENLGNNTGRFVFFSDGTVSGEPFVDDSDEAWDVVHELY